MGYNVLNKNRYVLIELIFKNNLAALSSREIYLNIVDNKISLLKFIPYDPN